MQNNNSLTEQIQQYLDSKASVNLEPPGIDAKPLPWHVCKTYSHIFMVTVLPEERYTDTTYVPAMLVHAMRALQPAYTRLTRSVCNDMRCINNKTGPNRFMFGMIIDESKTSTPEVLHYNLTGYLFCADPKLKYLVIQ